MGNTQTASGIPDYDFAYGDLVFDGRRPASFLAADGARETGIELFSMSKSYGMAGWRLGFAIGNAQLVARIEDLQNHVFAGVFMALIVWLLHGLMYRWKRTRLTEEAVVQMIENCGLAIQAKIARFRPTGRIGH